MKVSVARVLSRLILLIVFFSLSAHAQSSGYVSTDAFPGLSFASPVCIAAPPGETNRLFVVERDGLIIVITNLANPTRTVFMDISSRVTEADDERGLLGLAFHPGYATNLQFYVYYTGSATNGTSGMHDILSRFTTWAWDPNDGDETSEVRLFAQYDEADNHNAGDLHFGPDNYLYVSLGDEGSGNDAFDNSQRIDKDFFSAILRLDVDKRPGSLRPRPHPALGPTNQYNVPADNPFVGATAFNGTSVNTNKVRMEFWAVGLRNPWRFSFDPQTGMLYCGDVGQDAREEIDVITKGGNYGWAYREGTFAGPKSPPGGFSSTNPILDYARGSATNEGNCVIGGVVYRGSRFPDLVGCYVYADIGSGNVWRLKYDGTNVSSFQRLFTDGGISAFGIDPSNGDVLYASLNGSIQRIVSTVPTGALQVTINPAGAVSAGAKWQVDGGAFRNSGTTVLGLALGDHTVAYKTVAGWTAPDAQTVAITNATSTTNGVYVQVDSTKPTVTITSPASGLRVSNAVFSVTGTARDNAGVATVLCKLNDDGWTAAGTANGWTNWNLDLSLAPGTNVIRAYAVDTSGNLSTTSRVTLVYELRAPLSVQLYGQGSVAPDLDGHSLLIGKPYTLTATAADGFAFANWTGSLPTNKAKLTFVMASNLTLIANFADVRRPVLTILSPPVNKRVTNTFLALTGKAKDNVGVDSVWYQLNRAGWNAPVSTNNWTNWLAAGLIPNLGTNLVQAWAADAAGNFSLTSNVKFVYVVMPSADWAPDTLSGLIAQVAPDGATPVTASFDAFTFNQTGGTNDDFSLGQYFYSKTGTNTALLSLTNTAPPSQTNDLVTRVALIFTNHYSGIFTNDDGDSGSLRLALATNLVPSTFSMKKLIARSGGSTNVTTLTFSDHGTFTKRPSNSGTGTASSGGYALKRYSPIGALLTLTFTGMDAGNVAYVQVTFTWKKGGNYVVTSYDYLGNLVDTDAGTFTLQSL